MKLRQRLDFDDDDDDDDDDEKTRARYIEKAATVAHSLSLINSNKHSVWLKKF